MRADIQGLRALAVLLVVAAHVTGVPAGGFIGVDVFFVISGYLITGLLLREKQTTGRVSLKDFYLRRARRILPAALIVLVATNVAARVIFAGARVHQTFVDALWAFGFAANVHFARLGTSYFDAERPRSALLHFWSLAVEEQFYVVWPCLLILALVVTRRWAKAGRPAVVVAAVAAVVIAGSLVFALTETSAHPVSSYYSTATRAWEFGAGALTACLVALGMRVPVRMGAIATWLSLAAIVASAVVITETTPFPGLATVAPVVATAVILGVGDVRGGIGARWALGLGPVQFIGGASYSLYLWHWPALIFAEAYYGKGTTTARVVAALVSFALATLTYAFIEQPVRVTRRIRPLLLAPTALALVGTVALMADTAPTVAPLLVDRVAEAITTTTTDTTIATGSPGVTPTSIRRTTTTTSRDEAAFLAQVVKTSVEATSWGTLDPSLESLPNAGAPEWIADKCLDISDENVDRCVYGNPAAPRLAMVVGDSVAVSYLPGLRNVLTDWRIQVLTLDLCPMVDAPTRQFIGSQDPDTRCTAHQKWVHERVQAAHPDLLIVASAINSANRLVDHGEKSSADNASRWGAAFGREMARLVPMAGRVVVIGSPTGTKNLQECATRFSSPRDCAIDLYPFWGMIRDAERSAATEHGATYVDPLSWLCYANVCPAVIGSTPVNWDGAHLTAAYSRRLAPVLAPFFQS